MNIKMFSQINNKIKKLESACIACILENNEYSSNIAMEHHHQNICLLN